MLRNVIGKAKRIGIAAAIDDAPIAAHHQPTKVPIAASVPHGDARQNSNERVRTDDKQPLLRIIIRGTAIHEDFVIRDAICSFAEVRTKISDAKFNRAARRERIDEFIERTRINLSVGGMS